MIEMHAGWVLLFIVLFTAMAALAVAANRTTGKCLRMIGEFLDNAEKQTPPPVVYAEFEGIASGDNECFCWLVDAETFTRIDGIPPEAYDRGINHSGDDEDATDELLYRIYPPCDYPRPKGKLHWKLAAFPISEPNKETIE